MTKLVWTEIWVDDLQAAMKFYAALFKWTFESFAEYDPENYFIANSFSGASPQAALVKSSGPVPGAGGGVVPYFTTDSIEESLQTVGESDVHIVTLPPDSDRFCILKDPAGNRVGLWEQAKPHCLDRGPSCT